MNASIFTGLRVLAEKFVTTETKRSDTDGWWKTPLMASAPIDQRFDQLSQIAADDHWHPQDLLPTARSVLVFYIPFQQEINEYYQLMAAAFRFENILQRR